MRHHVPPVLAGASQTGDIAAQHDRNHWKLLPPARPVSCSSSLLTLKSHCSAASPGATVAPPPLHLSPFHLLHHPQFPSGSLFFPSLLLIFNCQQLIHICGREAGAALDPSPPDHHPLHPLPPAHHQPGHHPPLPVPPAAGLLEMISDGGRGQGHPSLVHRDGDCQEAVVWGRG